MNIPLYDALKKAGVPDDTARAAAIAVPNGEDIATKKDIGELRAEMRLEVAEVRTSFSQEMHRQTWRLVTVFVGVMALFAAVIKIL